MSAIKQPTHIDNSDELFFNTRSAIFQQLSRLRSTILLPKKRNVTRQRSYFPSFTQVVCYN